MYSLSGCGRSIKYEEVYLRLRDGRRGESIHWPIYRVLQRSETAFQPEGEHPRSGLLQPPAGSTGSLNQEEIPLKNREILSKQPGPPLYLEAPAAVQQR